MKTVDLIRRYFSENFWIIPIQKNSKVPIRKNWTEEQLGFEQTLHYLRNGYNIGVVGGKQSRSPIGEDLIMLDFDGRLGTGTITDNIEQYRKLNTWVQFTPKGFHVILRYDRNTTDAYLNSDDGMKNEIDSWITYNGLSNPHRTTLEPKHEDNTFNTSKDEHDKYFLDTIRWTSMYILVCPSKVDNKNYWWLDDLKGEILSI